MDFIPSRNELSSWIGTAVVCCDMQDIIAQALLKIQSATSLDIVDAEVDALMQNMHKAHIVADEEFVKIGAPRG